MSMRRNEIIEALNDAIDNHFASDAARAFDRHDFDGIARMLQQRDVGDKRQVDGLVGVVASQTGGWEVDKLADGDMDNPNAWLYARLRDA